jgi:hypothetical protein
VPPCLEAEEGPLGRAFPWGTIPKSFFSGLSCPGPPTLKGNLSPPPSFHNQHFLNTWRRILLSESSVCDFCAPVASGIPSCSGKSVLSKLSVRERWQDLNEVKSSFFHGVPGCGLAAPLGRKDGDGFFASVSFLMSLCPVFNPQELLRVNRSSVVGFPEVTGWPIKRTQRSDAINQPGTATWFLAQLGAPSPPAPKRMSLSIFCLWFNQ